MGRLSGQVEINLELEVQAQHKLHFAPTYRKASDRFSGSRVGAGIRRAGNSAPNKLCASTVYVEARVIKDVLCIGPELKFDVVVPSLSQSKLLVG